MTSYACGICGTKRDQRSHHKLHLDSEKHKQSKELFRHQLKDMDGDDRLKNYFTDDIGVIIGHMETQEYNKEGDLVNDLRMYAVQNITNKDALRDKIHEIHNFLRNNGIGYGMNALKAFNVLYGLMRIEESGLFDKVDLPMECRFSYLVDLSKKNKHEKVTGLILGKVLDSIIQHKKMKHFLFYELPKNVRADVYSQLVLQIHELRLIEKSCGVQLSGKIYEYFIGRDDTAISEMGAYFTDRHIVEFINEEEPPHVDEDGHVSTMIDPFGGSGGFTNGYIQHLVHQHPDLKWEDEIKNIYHYDMNEDVNKSAALEMFCLTGEIPVMNENVKCCNSFTSDFCNLKFKQVRTNPPYGGDKSKQTDAQQKRDKMISHIKGLLDKPEDVSADKLNVWKLQLKRLEQEKKKDKARSDKQKVSLSNSSIRIKKFAKKHGLKGNDKEAVSLILLMDILDKDGTAVGVLKEGVFFNKSYKDVRECVIKNFHVRKVISVPSDQFENTTTKTSIIVFDNTEQKTTKVEFSELVVEKYEDDVFVEGEDGSILLVENKGDIKGVSKNIVAKVDVGRLKENDWSLNGKDYVAQKIVAGDGYKLATIGDICDIDLGTRIVKDNCVKGDIPVYGGGGITFYTDKPNRQANTLVVGRYAISKNCVRLIPHEFYLNDSGMSIVSKDNALQEYISFLLLFPSIQEYIHAECTSGTIQRNISMKRFKNLQLSIPKSPEKMKMWVDKISKPYHEMREKKKQLKQLQEQVQTRVKEIIENEPCDDVPLTNICKINPETLSKNKLPYINYIDISCVSEGVIHNVKRLDKDYPSRAKRIVHKNDILYASVRPNLKGYSILTTEVDNCVATTGFIVIRPIDIPPMYVYFAITLESVTEYLISKATGSSYPSITSDVFDNIKISVPRDRSLLTELLTFFEKINQLVQEVSNSEFLFNQYIKELGAEAIVSR